MKWNLLFFLQSALLGAGLAMDAFSVSLADGLGDPHMKRRAMCTVAGVFAGFQCAMPFLGWICVHTVLRLFRVLERIIPWIAFFLLALIGGKMLLESARQRGRKDAAPEAASGSSSGGASGLSRTTLLVQGVATSIDALSVGFTLAAYEWSMALAACLLIGVVTFVICLAGLAIGKKFGTRLSRQAQCLGGAILIAIGAEIFFSGVL